MSLPPNATLPPGTIAWVGWANRLLVVIYCLWLIAAAWPLLRRGAVKKASISAQ